MFIHYLLISWRSILRNKFYSIILTLGLALGVASSLLLGLFTWHELTFDHFHAKKDQVFLVGVDSKEGSEESKSGYTTPPTGPALQDYFPEIESYARLAFWFDDDVIVSRDDEKFVETGIVGADSSVFDIFTIPFLSGNPHTALTEPNSVVLTQETATRYFGKADPIGKTLHFDHFFAECKVTGVVENYPDNSHFDFNVLLSMNSLQTIRFDFGNSWANHTFATYVILNPNANVRDIETRMQSFIKSKLDPFLIEHYQKSYDELYANGDHYKLFLYPLRDIHLSTFIHENQEGKSTLVYALGLIGIIIILLVCINYTNLATVLSLSRVREAGIRKAVGSRSNSLFKQFITESLIIALAGLFLGLALTELLLPTFNSMTHQNLYVNYSNPFFTMGLLGFALFIGLLAGFYPATIFASLNPVKALKGNTHVVGNRHWTRNSLVIFQLTVCIVMTACTIVVFKQLDYMMHKSLGFDKDQILVIKRAEGLKNNKAVFKNELLKGPGIESVSYSQTTPGRNFNGHGQHFSGRPVSEMETIFPLIADDDILQTLGVELVNGNSFKQLGVDRPQAILNEKAVNLLGLQKPLEEKIDRGTLGTREVHIVGVVKDFHFKSFHHNVEPLVIFPLDVENDPNHNAGFVLVRIDGHNISTTLEHIHLKWKALAGNYPFAYSFMDDDFDKLFEREQTMAIVYTIFSVISISIACLGMLGLISFFAHKRTKEIGIRKIVGATTSHITILLCKQFMRWLLISVVIGSAFAWYLMNKWLQNFAYQTEMSGWVFVIAGGFVLGIALLTVGWQVFKAATRNPVESLRYE